MRSQVTHARSPIRAGAHTTYWTGGCHRTGLELEQAPRAATELLTQQAAAEVNAYQERHARDALASVTGSARAMAGLLGCLAILLGLALATMPFWLPEAGTLDTEVRLTLSATIFLIVSTAITLTMATDSARLVTPGWLRGLGDLIRHVRG